MSNAPDNVQALPRPEKPSAALPVTVDVNNPTSLYLDTAVFNQIQRVAVLMSRAGLAPQHLRGDDKVADCILVVAQALRWKSDPFAVAQHTFVTQGKLGYEGKLIAAMVNSSGKLKENLNYTYSGEGDARAVVVSGTLKGSDRLREIDGTVGKWKTANKFWKDNPDQMLAYRGAREWARRHMPEVLLGVNSEDEIAPRTMVDVTPQGNAAAINDALSRVVPPSEASDLRTVDGEVVDAKTGEIIDDDTTSALDEGDAAERAAAVALRDRLVTALADLPDREQVDAYYNDVAADADTLPADLRKTFTDAVAARQNAIAKRGKK